MAAMYLKTLLVKKSDLNSDDYSYFKKDLVRVFKNFDYLEGYCEGYGFSKLSIKSLKEIEEMHENGTLDKYHLFFVKLDKL